MSSISFRTASALALAATISMAASPALAAEVRIPVVMKSAIGTMPDPAGIEAAKANGWRGGWGGGWRRHRDRVDAGDVLAGILIIGGIAAIASAASKSDRDRQRAEQDDRYREPDRRYDRNYDDRGPDNRPEWRGGMGINTAVGACTDEIERDNRVDTVDSVSREDDGWRVDGRIAGGAPFSCSVDAGGRISRVTVDGQAR